MLALLSFLLALLILVLVHEYGHFQVARFLKVGVEEFGFGFPPTAYQRRVGGTIYSLNWLPLGGFVRLKGEEEAETGADSFSAQSPARRALIVVAGVVMNMILAVAFLAVGYAIGLPQELATAAPRGAIVRDVQHQVVDVLPGSPAASAFQPGDRLETLDGQSFTNYAALQSYIRRRGTQPITVHYLRNGAEQVVTLTPVLLPLPAGDSIYGLGVEVDTTGVVSYPFYLAPLAAIKEVGRIFALIAVTLWALISGLFVHAPLLPQVTGPIGIAYISGEVAHLGVLAYLQFLAILSINLAFVNCLPLPALDGGRLLFIFIEWIRGRPVSRELEMRIHSWGMTALLLLVVLVSVHDVGQFYGVQVSASWNAIRNLLKFL